MSSNGDIQHQDEETTGDRASADATVSKNLPNKHTFVVDEATTDEVGAAPLSSDSYTPCEFTFFQKKKSADQAFEVPTVAHASTAQVTAFVTRLDIAAAANNKTQRHISELMILMSDMGRTMIKDVSSPKRKRFCWSKWLFYGCLVSCGVGWFLLFPTGHDLLRQLAIFLIR